MPQSHMEAKTDGAEAERGPRQTPCVILFAAKAKVARVVLSCEETCIDLLDRQRGQEVARLDRSGTAFDLDKALAPHCSRSLGELTQVSD